MCINNHQRLTEIVNDFNEPFELECVGAIVLQLFHDLFNSL